MAWEWSHSPTAYQAAQVRLYRLSKKKLVELWTEWKVYDVEEAWKAQNALWLDGEADEPEDYVLDNEFTKYRAEATELVDEQGKSALAAEVWTRMEAFATCDNGGHNAWCCPYGCGCHTVSFDTIKGFETLFNRHSGVPYNIQQLASDLREYSLV